jgi:hypothetical protein
MTLVFHQKTLFGKMRKVEIQMFGCLKCHLQIGIGNVLVQKRSDSKILRHGIWVKNEGNILKKKHRNSSLQTSFGKTGLNSTKIGDILNYLSLKI